jgi:hypothetical protein
VIGVLPEGLGGGLVELLEAVAGGVEHGQQRSCLDAHGVLHCWWLPQLWFTEGVVDLGREAVDVALAPAASQRCGDAGLGQVRGRGRGWCDGQDYAGVGAGEVGGSSGREGLQEAGVVLAQQRPQLVGRSCAPPGGVLVGAGKYGDRAGQFAVVGQRSVGVGVGAQDVGQHHRVGVVALGPGDGPALAVAGHRHRVDRIHRPLGGAQCRDQQAAWGFDRYRDRVVRGVAGRGQQFDERREALDGVVEARFVEELALGVDQGDVVVAFGPVDSARHCWAWTHPQPPSEMPVGAGRAW